MINFKQISNGDGPFKILISCNDDDKEKYLKIISNDILNVQKCSIFYVEDYEDGIEDIDDYKVQLSEFNLFVFPITNKFLMLPSRTRDIDYEFAVKERFHILPILVENGLYDKFNNYRLKNGEPNRIQALDKTIDDSADNSYKVKLEKYIKSIFIDYETIKKIRDAFDAYIFLSYRKKDRKYAQEIMALIHENDFMRDIAIWYDEFLTLGEDFDNEISENLLKSKLMTLVVTPNINERYGEKGNYVIEEEYPCAIKENKPIVPIEAVETDREELKNNFKDIQNPINKDNHDEITNFFKKFIISNGLDMNDNDPEHLYFIGLAYLNGIDVERNIQKAIKIFEDLTVNNYLPAYDVLANYYKNIEFDYPKSNRWLEKAYDFCLKNYGLHNSVTEQYYEKLVSSLYTTRCDGYCIKFLSNRITSLIINHDFNLSLKTIEEMENISDISRYGFHHRIFELLVHMYSIAIEIKDADVNYKDKILNKLLEVSYEIDNSGITDSLKKLLLKVSSQSEDSNMFETIIMLCKFLNNEDDNVIFEESKHHNEMIGLIKYLSVEIENETQKPTRLIEEADDKIYIKELKGAISDCLLNECEDMHSCKKLEFLEYWFIFNKLVFNECNYDFLASEFSRQENDTFIELATYIFMQEYENNNKEVPSILSDIQTYFDMYFDSIDYETYLRDYLTEYFDFHFLFALRD